MSWKSLPARALLLVAALSGGACVSLEELAPRVETLAAEPGRAAQLDRGREIYVTKCAKCHSPEPVLKYSAAHWREIIVEMSEETKLDAAETEALRAYVFAVLERRA